MRACTDKTGFFQYKTCLTHPKSWRIGRSKELEDVGRVASSFPTYLGKVEATLLAGYCFPGSQSSLSGNLVSLKGVKDSGPLSNNVR